MQADKLKTRQNDKQTNKTRGKKMKTQVSFYSVIESLIYLYIKKTSILKLLELRIKIEEKIEEIEPKEEDFFFEEEEQQTPFIFEGKEAKIYNHNKPLLQLDKRGNPFYTNVLF